MLHPFTYIHRCTAMGVSITRQLLCYIPLPIYTGALQWVCPLQDNYYVTSLYLYTQVHCNGCVHYKTTIMLHPFTYTHRCTAMGVSITRQLLCYIPLPIHTGALQWVCPLQDNYYVTSLYLYTQVHCNGCVHYKTTIMLHPFTYTHRCTAMGVSITRQLLCYIPLPIHRCTAMGVSITRQLLCNIPLPTYTGALQWVCPLQDGLLCYIPLPIHTGALQWVCPLQDGLLCYIPC